MADLKNYSSPSDFNIYLSFHLVGDKTFEIQKKFLENLLYNHFGKAYDLEHEDPPEAAEREVVYSLERPLLTEDAESNRKFFEGLKDVFEQSQRYLPSFTQGLEQNQ